MDARQRRSRQRLHAAVLELAATTPVADLTATAIARAAGVHRSTFYEHAASPGDLLRQALEAELDALRDDLLGDPDRDPGEAMSEVTGRVLEHVSHHAAIYRRGLAADSGAGSLQGLLAEHFLGSVRSLDEQGRITWPAAVPGVPADVVRRAAAHWVAQGTVGAIQAWLDSPGPLDAAAFRAVHARLVPSWWGVGPARRST